MKRGLHTIRLMMDVSTKIGIDIVSILVSILRYLSKNPHQELHIHKLVTYFDVFQLADFGFF